MKRKLLPLIAALCLVMGFSTAALAAETSGTLTAGTSVTATSGEADSDYIFSFTPESDGVYQITLTAEYSGWAFLETGEYKSNYTSTDGEDSETITLKETFNADEEYEIWVTFEESSNVEFTILVEEYTKTGSCGDNVTWTYSDGVLTISGTGDMEDYEYDENYPTYSPYSDLITSVVVEDGVTSVGTDAFMYYENITSVTLADSVTKIGDYAFFCATDLTSINLENVTYLGGSSLQGTALSQVTLSNNLTYYGGYALASTDITSITIPASLTTLGEAPFAYCSSLSTITVEDGNTVCKVVDGVLYNYDMTVLICYPAGKSGSEFTIPDGVVELGDFAFGNTSLTTINFADSVTTIGGDCFYRGVFTEFIVGKNVETIGDWAFESCYYLDTIYIPVSVTTIEDFAFFTWSSTEITYYYQGTEDQWEQISGHDNAEGTIVYHCEDVWDGTSIDYEIIESETNASYTIGSNETVVIAVDAHLDCFVSVAVDGTVLTQDEDYTVSEGSTIITFADSYIETLEAGTYDVVITFRNGTASAELVVLSDESSVTVTTGSTSNTTTDDSDSSESTTAVETGDSSSMFVWIVLAICAAAAAVVFGKKRFNM